MIPDTCRCGDCFYWRRAVQVVEDRDGIYEQEGCCYGPEFVRKDERAWCGKWQGKDMPAQEEKPNG